MTLSKRRIKTMVSKKLSCSSRGRPIQDTRDSPVSKPENRQFEIDQQKRLASLPSRSPNILANSPVGVTGPSSIFPICNLFTNQKLVSLASGVRGAERRRQLRGSFLSARSRADNRHTCATSEDFVWTGKNLNGSGSSLDDFCFCSSSMSAWWGSLRRSPLVD